MSLLDAVITTAIWKFISSWFMQFWGWLVAGGVAVLAFMFSVNVRKYTIAAIAILVVLAGTFVWGYTSNHHVTTVTKNKPVMITHKCSEFQKYLVKNAGADKAISLFKKHKLCT